MDVEENMSIQSHISDQLTDETSLNELEKITNDYPYFSIAQLMLSKRMKHQNQEGFLAQVQKTALFFPNPFWLHYQLLNSDFFEDKNAIDPSSTHDEDKTLTFDKTELKSIENDQSLNSSSSQNEKNEIQENNLTEAILIDESHEIEQPVSEMSNMKLAELLQEQASEFKQPLEASAKLPVEGEPYYTVDYFASQGIKLDTQTQDKLGARVLRFTDWLKQMKRINPQPADLGTDTEMENRVQTIAASSNEPKEVLTEAMAEVLIQQGKIEKAIQLYIKLSFTNPDKSAYFAQKIEELKGLK